MCRSARLRLPPELRYRSDEGAHPSGYCLRGCRGGCQLHHLPSHRCYRLVSVSRVCHSRRREGITYRKNEMFIDTLESVNLLISQTGAVLRSEVVGKIVMKAFLTGMPECRFGLNDKLLISNEKKAKGNRRGKGTGVEIDDCSFHRCVRLGQFDQDRTITFIPPDGEFELMKYRVTENINLPFRILPVYEEIVGA